MEKEIEYIKIPKYYKDMILTWLIDVDKLEGFILDNIKI